MTTASTTTVLTALIALAVLVAVVAVTPLVRRRRRDEGARAAGATAEGVPHAPGKAAGEGAGAATGEAGGEGSGAATGEAGGEGSAAATGEAAGDDPAGADGDAADVGAAPAGADAAADDHPTADPGAVVADLHARAVLLREQVGWPSGEALAGMPTFRETVDAVLAKDLPDDALLRIGTDNDEFVASVGLAALVERNALPADWTDTAVRRLRRSGTQDEHFLLLTLVGARGR